MLLRSSRLLANLGSVSSVGCRLGGLCGVGGRSVSSRAMGVSTATSMAFGTALLRQGLPRQGLSTRNFSTEPDWKGSDPGVFDSSGATLDTGSEVIQSGSDVVEIINHAGEVVPAFETSWYPSHGVVHLLDYVQGMTGAPWWVTIVGVTCVLRTFMLPVIVMQMRNAAKLQIVRPHMTKFQEKLKMASANGDTALLERYQVQMKQLFVDHDIKLWKNFVGILVQAPVFMSFFFGLRAMSTHTPYYSSLTTGGDYWFTDLTVPDATYVLPVICSLTFIATIELNAEVQVDDRMKMMKNVMRFMGVMMVPITVSFPQAMLMYWVTSNCYSVVYGVALKAGLRDALGIPAAPQGG